MGRHLSAPWYELQVERDKYGERSFRLVFRVRTRRNLGTPVPVTVDSRYISERYKLRKGEDAVKAARALCIKRRWDKTNPATGTKG